MHPECNCHDCTQARYRMSFRFQLDQAFDNNKLRVVADVVRTNVGDFEVVSPISDKES